MTGYTVSRPEAGRNKGFRTHPFTGWHFFRAIIDSAS